jgi:indolepyruvate ferredoxin oxidoreductase
VSTTEVPTGAMITDTSVSFPAPATVRSAIADAVSRTVSLDARGLAEQLFDNDQFANILQLGAAFQTGSIPLPAEVIEQAITLNGTAVDQNLQAFRRGRQLVADPTALDAELAAPIAEPEPLTPEAAHIRALVAAPAGTELARLLDIRIPELIAYQNAAYARTYADFVEQVRVLEAGPTTVTEAVARNLHKLMAYKDEYEVARLSVDEKVLADLKNRFGSETSYSYRLHPPVLRALGMRRKISLGSWFRPGFRALYALRGVRGRWFDPFGRTEVRKVERALIEEYRTSILRAFAAPQPDAAVLSELAELPDQVRGYEDIKLGNVATYRTRQAELLAGLDSPQPERLPLI